MSNATFTAPCLSTFCELDELGLVVTRQDVRRREAILECRRAEPDPWCRTCGAEAKLRDTVPRRLAHTPFGDRPTTLLIRVRRYACDHCGRTWREDMTSVAEPRGKISHGGVSWALRAVVRDHLTIARVAEHLRVSWHTANDAVLSEGQRLLVNDPARFEGVTTIGVDEHIWRHVRFKEKYVTVIIDLTPIRNGTGPSRLLDLVPGRSKDVFRQWLRGQSPSFRAGIDVIAMDGFTGFKTAAAEVVPDATAVMDPFHVVRLAGECVDTTRQRVQQQILGHRGRSGDPLYQARRTLLTGLDLLNARQFDRIDALFATDDHVEVEMAWNVYQKVIGAYREKNKKKAAKKMRRLIEAIGTAVPAALVEIAKLGRTLRRRAADVLAYFEHPGTSNGPTEAINGRLEHLRGSALGFRNLDHYRLRALLETGGFRPALHSQMR